VIAYQAAVDLLREGVAPLPAQRVALAEAQGRVLAQDVASPTALPRFDNAALDGYALAARGAPLAKGSAWAVVGSLAAGAPAPAGGGAGAWEIMTGALLPTATDTVVPLEQVERAADGAGIRLTADVPPGANVRRRGEDVHEAQRVLARGEPLSASALLLLAGLGIAHVQAAPRPRVALLATGRELAAPGDALAEAAIHDANSAYLMAALADAGAQVVSAQRIGDDAAQFHAALDAALAQGVDLVVSTGAVSKGRHDFVPQALAARGAGVLFHGVAMRPGKPVLAARLAEGPRFVGLPGNPLATAVGARFFVEPLLRAWLGLAEETPGRLPLAQPCRKRLGLRAFLHAGLHCDDEGRLRVHVAEHQESFRLSPLLRAPVWAILPEGVEEASAGDSVQVLGRCHLRPLPWCGTGAA